MEWTIAEPAMDPRLLAIAFGLNLAALITAALALLGVVLAEAYPGRPERFARFMLGVCIVEGLPLITAAMTGPLELEGSGLVGALLLVLGLGVPALFGAAESFARLAAAVLDATDERVRRWTGRGWHSPTRIPERRWRDVGVAGPAPAAPPGILPCGAHEWDAVDLITPGEKRRARGVVVLGLIWTALGCLGVHAARGGAGDDLASALGSFAGLIRLLGIVAAVGAGLHLLVAWVAPRRDEGGSHVDAGE